MPAPRDPDIDPQDPLPEASFTWRRLLTFASTGGLGWLLWQCLERMPEHMVFAFSQGLLVLLLVNWLLYYGGASAAEISNFFANVRLRLGLGAAGRGSDRRPPP